MPALRPWLCAPGCQRRNLYLHVDSVHTTHDVILFRVVRVQLCVWIWMQSQHMCTQTRLVYLAFTGIHNSIIMSHKPRIIVYCICAFVLIYICTDWLGVKQQVTYRSTGDWCLLCDVLRVLTPFSFLTLWTRVWMHRYYLYSGIMCHSGMYGIDYAKIGTQIAYLWHFPHTV